MDGLPGILECIYVDIVRPVRYIGMDRDMLAYVGFRVAQGSGARTSPEAKQ